MLSKSLIQFSVGGWGCVPSLLFDLKPNYGGGNGNNGDLLQKVPCRQCPQPFSSSLLTHASAGASWTLTSKSGSVSCGVTAPFSWVLACTRFCLCPPRVCFPSPGEVPIWATWFAGMAHTPGQNPGVGCHALLQGIFPTQGSNPGLPHCR